MSNDINHNTVYTSTFFTSFLIPELPLSLRLTLSLLPCFFPTGRSNGSCCPAWRPQWRVSCLPTTPTCGHVTAAYNDFTRTWTTSLAMDWRMSRSDFLIDAMPSFVFILMYSLSSVIFFSNILASIFPSSIDFLKYGEETFINGMHSHCIMAYCLVFSVTGSCWLCAAGVLQAERLLAVCVVCSLHQPPPRLARWTGIVTARIMQGGMSIFSTSAFKSLDFCHWRWDYVYICLNTAIFFWELICMLDKTMLPFLFNYMQSKYLIHFTLSNTCDKVTSLPGLPVCVI